ncbi:unnamed protein product [Peniophora sp. CBMAI 1063]|nr:unnamed protein product [Peniophora sp. CBMAI 1063]
MAIKLSPNLGHLVYGIAFLSAARLAFAQKKVLIYSYVAPGEFVHDSIPTATQALISHGSSISISFDSTQDPSQFTAQNLKNYDGLLFLMTIGEVLDSTQQQAFRDYLDGGGNFIAVHAASDCLRNTSWYGEEVGAYFDYHPELQNATVDVIDSSHPATSMLPAQWHVQDEMYNFKSDPRSIGAVVLLSANDSSYNDPGPRKFNQGTPHPTAWYQEKGAGVESNGTAGRSFYTSLGHLSSTWQDDLFLSHILGGVQWAVEATASTNTSSSASSTASASASATSASSAADSSSPASQSSGTQLGSMGMWATSLLSALGALVFVP